MGGLPELRGVHSQWQDAVCAPGAAARIWREQPLCWTLEWAIHFDLLQVQPGVPFNMSAAGPEVKMAINIAVGDTDRKQDGDPNLGLRHEQWLSGERANRACVSEFAT